METLWQTELKKEPNDLGFFFLNKADILFVAPL